MASVSRNGVVTLESEMPVFRTVNVVVAGQRLALKTDQEPEVLEGMSAEINEIVDSIRQAAPGASAPQVMALALMQLMERVHDAERQDMMHCAVIERHAARLERLLTNLEAAESQE